MKLKFYILLLAILGILFAGFLFYFFGLKPEKQIQKIEKPDLIIALTSVQGSESATYLFGDGSFLEIHEQRTNSPCLEGKISSDQYDSFMDYVKSTDLLKLRITQRDDFGLVCESDHRVQITIDHQSNSLAWPCTREESASTQKVSAITGEVFNKLAELTSNTKQACRAGGFINTRDLGNCADYARENHLTADQYNSHNLSDLDPWLMKSLINEGADVYIGPIDKIKESYNGMVYALAGHCYAVSLSEFDGRLFRSYDDALRERK